RGVVLLQALYILAWQSSNMSSSAAEMNAVPESGPVKTVQLEGKIIAITGANRGNLVSGNMLQPVINNLQVSASV
nr:hypothetical protein [Tanacetum cinerariifolium]